jgi:hypothetical protein
VLPVELPGACASVSIAIRQPASTASRSSRFGGSSRSGPAVHLDRHVEAGAGGEDQLGVELALRPALAAAAVPDDLPAGAVAQHVGVRVADGGDHPRGSSPRGPSELGVHAAPDEVEPGQQRGSWSSDPSSRMSHSMPVSSRNGGRSPASASAAKTSLSPATTSSCSRSRCRAQAVGRPSAAASGP